MKKILVGLFALSLMIVFGAANVEAREGAVKLSGGDVACEGVSLWKERNYRVSGRCEGLVYPYETQYEHYVIWAKTDNREEVVRVGEVDRGYFDGNVGSAFSSLYVTAESDGLPRKPSTMQVASGSVSPFSFATSGGVVEPLATPAPATTNESMTVQDKATSTVSSTSTVGSVIGKILRSLLIIIGVVILLVIGTSLIFRRRGSIST